jgi:vacuole morphology and inheritance protein 14
MLYLKDRSLLEIRGALVVRKLAALLDGSSIYLSLATILGEYTDFGFVDTMVQTLSLILLTAPELSDLRRTMKDCFQAGGTEEDRQVFFALFACWSHNPVATFSLCLLAQAYDLSSKLILKFAEVDVTVGFLMQIDKLVQLLESPIFVRLRLHMLDVSTTHHIHLVKSLYGLLMLLPQSQAYKTLSDRLHTISSLQLHISGLPKDADGKGPGKPSVIHDNLLKDFESVQEKHTNFRSQLMLQKKLGYEGGEQRTGGKK